MTHTFHVLLQGTYEIWLPHVRNPGVPAGQEQVMELFVQSQCRPVLYQLGAQYDGSIYMNLHQAVL